MDEFPKTVLGARKLSVGLQMSDEQLMDMGMIPDTRPPAPVPIRPNWRTRARLKVALLRIRLGEIVAGQTFEDECERDHW